VANIVNCFIKSYLRITTASGWLQQLVGSFLCIGLNDLRGGPGKLNDKVLLNIHGYRVSSGVEVNLAGFHFETIRHPPAVQSVFDPLTAATLTRKRQATAVCCGPNQARSGTRNAKERLAAAIG
jgi:hypothetical protein